MSEGRAPGAGHSVRFALPCAVAVAFGLLALAWTMANRPFSGPDESPHYLRALSIANGSLVGARMSNPRSVLTFLTLSQQLWVARDLRMTLVPAELSPPDIGCVTGRPDVAGQCLEPSGTGDYGPLPYLLPAVAMSTSDDAGSAIWLARLGSVVPCAAFVILALFLLWDGAALSLLGLLAAISPMVFYVSSVVNPNGLEIAASLACAASVLRLSRAPLATSRWVWRSLALSGATAALAWQLGPVFVALDLCAGAILIGRADLWRMRATREPRMLATVLGCALAGYLAYGLMSGSLHSTLAIRPIRYSLNQGFQQLSPVLFDSVFRLLSASLPRGGYWLWWGLVVLIAVWAVRLGTARERLLVASVTAGALAFPVVFFAWAYRLTGFGMQGRYVLPALMLIPLVSGEVIRSRAGSIGGVRSAARVMFAVIGVFQLAAWWINARAAAGSPGTFWFLSRASWSPPLGWATWCACALVATCLLAAVAIRPRPGTFLKAPGRPAW